MSEFFSELFCYENRVKKSIFAQNSFFVLIFQDPMIRFFKRVLFEKLFLVAENFLPWK